MLTYPCGIKILVFVNVYVLYHFCIPSANCTTANKSNDNGVNQFYIWNMVREFGLYQGAKFWSLHYHRKLDASWIRFYQEMVKKYTNIHIIASAKIWGYLRICGSNDAACLQLTYT